LREECRQWQQHHPLPPRQTVSGTVPIVRAPRPELEGVGRSLSAVPIREIVLHELGTLLQAGATIRAADLSQRLRPTARSTLDRGTSAK
jgi:hypothetical protein